MNEKSIGEQIKDRRKQLGIKQKELADRTGIAAQNLSFYESGRRTVSIDTLRLICDALGLEIKLVPKPTPK